MKLAITSFSAGFHGKNNTAPIFEDVGGYYVPWHQRHKLEGADAIYVLGWYISGMQALQQHRELLNIGVPVILHWAGSDVLLCREFGEDIDISGMWAELNQPHIVHTAGRPALIGEVRDLGIRDIRQCHVASRKVYEPMPFQIRAGGSIDPLCTIYMPRQRLAFFNFELIVKVAEKLPKINFIMYSFSSNYDQHPVLENLTDWGKLSDPFLDHLMAASNMHLRIVEHDGMSLSVVENCMAGRRVITNMDYPKLPTVKADVDEIVEAIEEVAYLSDPREDIAKWYRENYGPEKQKDTVLGILKEKGVYDGVQGQHRPEAATA